MADGDLSQLQSIEKKIDALTAHITGDGNPQRGLLQRMARVEWILMALVGVIVVFAPVATSVVLWWLGPSS